jgi:perosamine synthetase
MKVPLARPEVLEADIAAVVSALRSPRLSQGPVAQAFEDALAGYLGVTHGVAVNSGTSALQLSLRALGIGNGDEVIAPSFSFMAVTNALLSERAVPVFVDIDPRTLNVEPASLEKAISKRTKAIMLVHSFGFPAPVQDVVRFARRHSLAVIEDACEALGAEVHGQKTGSFGDIGIVAFYPNKVITTGEGGAVLTNSGPLAARIRSLRNQGRLYGSGWFEHCEPGFSYRLSDINCALGLQQLSRIDQILQRRQDVAAKYKRRLESNGYISCFGDLDGSRRISWFTYPVLLSHTFNQEDRDEIWAELGRMGIETGRYFAPSHLQPALTGIPFRSCDLSATVSVAERLLCLPLFPSLSETEIEFVCAALDDILSRRAASSSAVQSAVNW